MSGVIEAIAFGLVNLDEATHEQRKAIQHAARTEAHGLGYWISGCRGTYCCQRTAPIAITAWANPAVEDRSHKLTRWNKNTFREHGRRAQQRRPGINDRNRPLHEGSFVDCCRALMKLENNNN